MLRQAIRTVRDAQRLVREGEVLLRQLRSAVEPLQAPVRPQPEPQQAAAQPEQERAKPARKGHGPDCKHCQQVEAYRLERDSQVRFAESLANGDEDYRPITYREYLTRVGQERRAQDEAWANEWAEA